jgi:hypothetical protein
MIAARRFAGLFAAKAGQGLLDLAAGGGCREKGTTGGRDSKKPAWQGGFKREERARHKRTGWGL